MGHHTEKPGGAPEAGARQRLADSALPAAGALEPRGLHVADARRELAAARREDQAAAGPLERLLAAGRTGAAAASDDTLISGTSSRIARNSACCRGIGVGGHSMSS